MRIHFPVGPWSSKGEIYRTNMRLLTVLSICGRSIHESTTASGTGFSIAQTGSVRINQDLSGIALIDESVLAFEIIIRFICPGYRLELRCGLPALFVSCCP